MPLNANALVTVQEVRDECHVPATTADARVEAWINRASDEIESYCDRKLVSQTHTALIFDGCGDYVQLAPEWPVTAIVSIDFLDGVSPTSWENALADVGAEYVIEQREKREIVLRHRRWPRGLANVRMTFTAGYASNAIPGDLKEACFETVTDLISTNAQHNARVVSTSIQGQTTTYFDGAMWKPTRRRLDRFRRVA